MKKIIHTVNNNVIDETFNVVADYLLHDIDMKKMLARAFKEMPCPETDPVKKEELENMAIKSCIIDMIKKNEDVEDAFSTFAVEIALESFLPLVKPDEEDIENAETLDFNKMLRKLAKDILKSINE